MAYIADKPYDEVKLAKAVRACIHTVLDNRFPGYGKTVSCITCIRHRYTQTIIGMPPQKKHTYEFEFNFTRRQECDFDNPKEFVKPNSPEFTNVILTFAPGGCVTCMTRSDTGKMFAAELDKEVEKTVMRRYYSLFDLNRNRVLDAFRPVNIKENIESLSGGKYKFDGFVPTEIAKAIENSENTAPDWPKENPALKTFVNGTYNKIRSTLKKIVEDTIGGNFDYIIEWRFEFEKTPRRASAQYKLCKGALESILLVVVIFKDGGSNLETISVYTEDDSIREMVSCLPHEIRVHFNPLFNEEEKEKKEMTTSEANYIYSVRMTSEMREACDMITEDAIQEATRNAYRKASYENYKLKARLNAAYGTAALAVGAENKKLAVKEIVINEPAMVVFWEDGTKTVVTARDEAFDAEKGLAMAFAKKALGNNWAAGGRFKAKLKHAKWAPKKQEKKKDIFCEENLREDAKEVVDPDLENIPICKEIMKEAERRVEKKKTAKKKK